MDFFLGLGIKLFSYNYIRIGIFWVSGILLLSLSFYVKINFNLILSLVIGIINYLTNDNVLYFYWQR